jgi:hypothetical protein
MAKQSGSFSFFFFFFFFFFFSPLYSSSSSPSPFVIPVEARRVQSRDCVKSRATPSHDPGSACGRPG